MAEQQEKHHSGDEETPDSETPGYKPPAVKSVDEIIEQDKDDESLRKYKEALLGGALSEKVVIFKDDPRHVIVNKLALLVEGRPDVELDLSGKFIPSPD